jgi:hypothetical protein
MSVNYPGIFFLGESEILNRIYANDESTEHAHFIINRMKEWSGNSPTSDIKNNNFNFKP